VNRKTVLRFHDAAQIEGTITDQQRSEHERAVREARLEFARQQPHWTEVAETSLVRRGPFLVHATTDELFVHRRGHVWEPGRATIYVPENTPMTFTVNERGEVVFLEPPSGPRTWSEVVARKASREHRAAS
jgi:hypothetical protein